MSEDELKRLLEELVESIKALSEKQNSQYTDVMLLLKGIEEKLNSLDENNSTITFFDDDEMFEEAKKLVVEAKKASTSYLQRRLGIGYSRAAQLMDKLEEEGVIGEGDGAKPREVLLDSYEEPETASLLPDGTEDELYEDVKAAVQEAGKVSIPYLQRKFDIGFARSARLIDALQVDGLVEKGDYKKILNVVEKKEE